MLQSESFNQALVHAQDHATATGQNIVDIPTIALGILQTDSPFSAIFSTEERERMIAALAAKTEELGENDLETEAVPYTMNAGLLVKYARQYAEMVGDGELEIYHLMLALMSYQNEVATIFSREGWIFENYLAELNNIVNPPIEAERMDLDLPPSVSEPYSKLRKKFWAEDYKRNIVDNLLAEAARHATFGKYESCKGLCDVVMDITTERTEAYRLIIYCLCSEKRYDEAIKQYEQWGMEDDTVRMNIGVCYRETGQHEKALEVFNSFDENTAELHNLKGYSLCALGRYEEAVKEYDAAIAMKSDYAFAWNNKGYALLRMGKVAEAKDNIMHSLSLDKGNAFAYRNLSLVNIEEKNKEEALKNIEQALFYRYRDRFGDDIDQIREKAEAI